MTTFIPSLKAGDWICFVDKMFKGIDIKDFLNDLWPNWDEWHMIVSGWGDGAGLNKAEPIPTIQETEEKFKETDFYAILAREAWYYKFGLAMGRLTWGLIVAIVLVRVL